MIKTEFTEKFKRTYSDTYMIRKIGTNEIYSDAVDLLTSNFEYEETEELLPQPQLTDAEMLISLGVQPNGGMTDGN